MATTTRNLIVIISSVIVAAIIVAIAIVIVNNRQSVVDKKNEDKTNIEEAMQRLEFNGRECQQAEDSERCKDILKERELISTGTDVACELLDGNSKENCYWSVARNELDLDFCKIISSQDIRSTCLDEIHFLLAEKLLDASECSKINDQKDVQSCVAGVELRVVASDQCAEYGIDPSKCSDNRIISQAYLEKNPSVCNNIQNSDTRQECVEEVGVIADVDQDGLQADIEIELGLDDQNPDFDGDGLLDGDEINLWRTDPANPDTDGDGFADGVEVNAGYNPLGAGTL